MQRLVVIGAGISGLASAHRALEAARAAGAELELLVLEAGKRVGGTIQTARDDQWVVESGPNGFLDNKPATLDLIRELGIESELLPSDEASKVRFLYVDGKLVALPTSPPAFLTSPVLPLRGRLRVLLEPFRGKGPGDETLAEFGRRRLGRHAVERLLDPFVSGVYAGDVEKLSVTAAFPAVKNLEMSYGGLMRGMRARKRERRAGGPDAAGGAAGPTGHLYSMRGGMRDLIDALAARLSASGRVTIRTGVEVTAVRRAGAEETRGGGAYEVVAGDEVFVADAVISAAPAPPTARFLAELDAEISAALDETPYVSVTVVGLGFPKADLGHDLTGFGFLIPSREERRILGCLWSSSIYPHMRAPGDHVLLRVMVGGARHPELAALDDAELLELVREELAATMGLRWSEPVHRRIFRWPQAIPQYVVGHVARRERIAARLREHPGLFITGNHLYGISVNDCTADAQRIGADFAAWLQAALRRP